MSSELNLGPINGHAVGRILKEVVRRAMVAIRNERFIFEATAKKSYSGSMDDVFTSADTKAQEIYLKTIRECFPDCGIIAEEGNLRIEPKNGCTAYFTVDPLDGTKAYKRRQSHGVGTMIALVDHGEIICAYIGDVMSNEVYGYRPGSDKAWRISDLDSFEEIIVKPGALRDSYALLRDPLEKYDPATRRAIGKFKSYMIGSGSIGTWAARLWMGEVRALFFTKGFETPWDSTPIIGISQKLGFRFLRPAEPDNDRLWLQYIPELPTAPYRREQDLFIIHEMDMAQFMGNGVAVMDTRVLPELAAKLA